MLGFCSSSPLVTHLHLSMRVRALFRILDPPSLPVFCTSPPQLPECEENNGGGRLHRWPQPSELDHKQRK